MIPRVRRSPWAAVDTEADSLHAYPEKLCLLQLSLEDGDELIDPLAGLDFGGLLSAFQGHELIFHGSDYDLRLFKRTYDFTPDRIFDTMLASRLLGETQFGLTHLAAKFLGVTLEKGPQKMNWAQRPLTPRMEEYARNDTRHLKPLSDLLRGQLAAKGRLAWLEQSCAKLIRDCSVPRQPDPEAWRLKGSDRLTDRAMGILRELWAWRETEAIDSNRPPFFIFRHDDMLDLAAAAADVAPEELRLPIRFSTRRRAAMIDALQRGRALPAENLPTRRPREFGNRPDMATVRRFNEIKLRRDQRAEALAIDPTLIAAKWELMDLARDLEAGSAQLMDWQVELLAVQAV